MERCLSKHIDKYCNKISIADACIFRRLLDWIKTLPRSSVSDIDVLLESKMLDLIRETYNGKVPDETDLFIKEDFRTQFICDYIAIYNKITW